MRKNVLLPLLPFHLGTKHEMPYTTRTITNAGQIKNVHVFVLEIQLVSVRRGDVDGFSLAHISLGFCWWI